MNAPYQTRPSPIYLPIAGGVSLELPLATWVPNVLYVLATPHDQPFTLPAGMRIQGKTELRRGTIFSRITDPALYRETNGVCFQASPWGILDYLCGRNHVFCGYRDPNFGEIPILEEHRESLWEMILTYFAYHTFTEDERVAARRRIQQIAQVLGLPRDEHKLDALIQLIYASREHDSVGRVNPGAFQASLAGARRKEDLRLSDIQAIERRLGIREIAVTQELARIKAIMDRAWHTIRAISKGWVALCPDKYAVYSERKFTRDEAELESVRDELASVLVGPFPMPFVRCAEEINMAITLRQHHKPIQAAEILATAAFSLQFKFAQMELYQRIRLPLSLITHRRKPCAPEQLHFLYYALMERRQDGAAIGIAPRMRERLHDEGFERRVLNKAIELLDEGARLLWDAKCLIVPSGSAHDAELTARAQKFIRKANAKIRRASRML